MRFQDVLLLVASLVLIVLIVLQSSEDSIESAFSGEKSELFNNKKERGFDLIMRRVTTGTSVAFVLLSVWAMAS